MKAECCYNCAGMCALHKAKLRSQAERCTNARFVPRKQGVNPRLRLRWAAKWQAWVVPMRPPYFLSPRQHQFYTEARTIAVDFCIALNKLNGRMS